MSDDTIWLELPREDVRRLIEALETEHARRAAESPQDACACGDLAEQLRAALQGEVRP
jgi:hypothetical protein